MTAAAPTSFSDTQGSGGGEKTPERLCDVCARYPVTKHCDECTADVCRFHGRGPCPHVRKARTESKRVVRPIPKVRPRRAHDPEIPLGMNPYVPMNGYVIEQVGRPVLTYGCGPCVSLTLRSASHVLVAHLSDAGIVNEDNTRAVLQYLIRRFLRHSGGPILELAIVQNRTHVRGGAFGRLFDSLSAWMGRFGAGRVIASVEDVNGMMVSVGEAASPATVTGFPDGKDGNNEHNLDDVTEHGTIALLGNGNVAGSSAATSYAWTPDGEWGELDPGA